MLELDRCPGGGSRSRRPRQQQYHAHAPAGNASRDGFHRSSLSIGSRITYCFLLLALAARLRSRPSAGILLLCGVLVGGSAGVLLTACSGANTGEQPFYIYWLVVVALAGAPTTSQ